MLHPELVIDDQALMLSPRRGMHHCSPSAR